MSLFIPVQNKETFRQNDNLLFMCSLRIDQKVSNNPYGYKLQEAQAILSEVRSIRDAISSGEKEKQELMQVKGHF